MKERQDGERSRGWGVGGDYFSLRGAYLVNNVLLV